MTTHAAAILAAGKGTRMRSQTPKVLHRICGMEMVSLVIDTANSTNLSPVAVVVPHGSRLIRETLGDQVIYVEQSKPLGSGHALLQARTALRDADNVVVLYGDMPLIHPETISEMVRLHDDKEACITLLTSTLAKPDGFGRVLRSSSRSITRIVEESEADESTLAIAEVKRCAARGLLGCVLPRFPGVDSSGEWYDEQWDPFWRTLLDVGWPGGIHVGGTGRTRPQPSTDPIMTQVERRRQAFAGHSYTDFAYHHILAGEVSDSTIGEIREAIQEPIQQIVDAIRRALEITPPELASDIVDRGIVMAGGGSMIRGLDVLVSQETSLPIRLDDDPLTCVVRGTGRILEDPEKYRAVLAT
ncbi:MAG: rod shape-determining protein [Gemmatimonadetes bacterium]|nr:rod shape-determining protein [Gemmatimonadota bacterium]